MRTSICVLLLCLLIGKNSRSNIIVTNATATQLATMIVGPNVAVSNATLTAPAGSYGIFTNASTTNLGLVSGTVLTTGKTNQVSYPASYFSNYINATAGDITLNGITGQTTFDACTLEFDVVLQCSPLKIKFVFGSEEYPEYAHSYNDGFGIFVTGANPTSWAYTNYDMARLPNTSIPITVNNVNQTSNSNYYVDNQTGGSIVYDGFTVPITASLDIVPCTVYHIKITIADGRDQEYDSAVFLQKENSSCSPSALHISPSPYIYACPGDSILLSVSGAENYSWAPASGLDTANGPAVIAAPSTTTTYTVFGFIGCDTADGITASVTIDMSGPNVIISPHDPNILFGDSIALIASGGADYLWLHNNQTSAIITVAPYETTTYTVVGTGHPNDWTCIDTATVIVDVYDDIFIPNAFTPNGDGVNDVFFPVGGTLATDPDDYEMLIFNRWGNLIFKTEDPNAGWDGNGAPEDVYIWEIRTSHGKYRIGHVSLIR